MYYNKNKNYCSLSPEGLFGVRFNYSCYLHDRQYRNEIIDRKTRKEADKNLKKEIVRLFLYSNSNFEMFNWHFKKWYMKYLNVFNKFYFTSKSKSLIWIRNKILSKIIANIYYIFVRIFGKKAWIQN